MAMDQETLARLVNEHAAGLLLYARQLCAAPEDIVQEAFIKLFRQRHCPEIPVAWLYRVVRNAAISAQRAAQRRKRHEGAAGRHMQTWFAPNEAGLDGRLVADMLEQLPTEQREVITLHLWAGRSFTDISAIMGCSASSAHRWYAAGLATLRERLRVECPNP